MERNMSHLAPLAGRPAPVSTVAARLLAAGALFAVCLAPWAGLVALVAR